VRSDSSRGTRLLRLIASNAR